MSGLLSYRVMSEGGKLVGTIGNILLDLTNPTAPRIAGFELSGGLGERISGRYPTFAANQIVRYGQDVIVVPDALASTF